MKEKDSYNEIIKQHVAYKDPKLCEHKPVDPKPSLKSVQNGQRDDEKKKDDVATADTEKEKRKTTLVASKKTPVDTKPEVEYKNP